jgi:hypothetical protein
MPDLSIFFDDGKRQNRDKFLHNFDRQKEIKTEKNTGWQSSKDKGNQRGRQQESSDKIGHGHAANRGENGL